MQGSHTHDFDTFEYNGPTSDREVVFNLGAYKSGSTSFDAAAQMLGLRSCKTGWGEVGPGGGVSFDINGVAAFDKCPVPGPDGCTPKRVRTSISLTGPSSSVRSSAMRPGPSSRRL